MNTSPTAPAQRGIPRRTLARGAAWAAPTLVVAAAVPAYAASGSCSPTLRSQGGLIYAWRVNGGDGSTQNMTVGAETYVNGLPAGVTVVKITYQWWIMNRQGQQSSGPGAFWVGNSTSSNRASQNRSAMPYTAGSRGWSGSLANTVNNSSVTFPDGTTHPAWDLNFQWDGNNGANGTYTSTADGCTNFVSGPSGRFGVTYNNVVPLTNCPSAAGTIPNFNTIQVTLSNGQVLTTSSISDGGSTCR